MKIGIQVVDDKLQTFRILLDSIQCTKCEVYEIGLNFVDGNRYQTYNSETNESYFDNSIHLTFAGLDRVRSVYSEIVSKL